MMIIIMGPVEVEKMEDKFATVSWRALAKDTAQWYESIHFFFSSRRRHTRSLCDWSSDVCSSDLFAAKAAPALPVVVHLIVVLVEQHPERREQRGNGQQAARQQRARARIAQARAGREIGRASCRERV